MEQNKESKPILRFTALKEKLDFKGNVIEELLEKEIVWETYDPEEIMNSVVRDGDYRSVSKPTLKNQNYATDFFKDVFFPDSSSMYNTWDEIHKYRTIGSDVVNGCMKFVIYDRASGEVMKWVSVDEKKDGQDV